MSKLDDIIKQAKATKVSGSQPAGEWSGFNYLTDGNHDKQQIKALFNELVGEDTPRPRDCCDNEGGVICWKESKVKAANELRADLRKRIGDL